MLWDYFMMEDGESAPGTSEGWIDWPIKASLRRYIEGLPDGSISAAGGVVVDKATFRWPATVQTDGQRTVYSGRGELFMSGHGGVLAIALSTPTLVVTPRGGTVAVDYPWASPSAEPPIVIAQLTPTPDSATFAVSLTDDGAELFNNYAAGAEMAPIKLSQP